MRRIAAILTLLLLAAGVTVAASAGADDKRTYQAELFNAFGLVEGSELRVAGVKAGTVTGLDITPEKTALITFEVGPEFPELKADASCSSEPQSLIAEYFLNCQPGQAEEPLEAPIEAARNQTTVQQDLVQNTLREPFKRRLQLLINEFGTALVGNSENLNAAIRSGAPALREFRKVLKILGRQNRIIAGLNTDADTVFARLTERREDIVRFIDEAEDTARVSAERREDLSRDFDLLDDFLVELRPVMVELGSFWGYYSLWLRTAVPGAVSHLVEPDPNNLEVGRRHFRINGLPATFHQYAAGGRTHPPEPFRCESDGVERQVPAITVEELMRREGLERVDLLLADIQGPELQMLEGAAGPIREGRLRFLVLSTHHMSITGDPLTHQRCRAMVEALGGHVVTEHSVSESYSGDGLIAASFDPRDRDMHVHVSANRARDSLFGEPEFEVAARDAEIARLRGVLRDH